MSHLSHVTSFAAAPRLVKPRRRQYKHLPVVALHRNTTLTEGGETGSLNNLMFDLHKLPPTLFVKQSAADFVAELDNLYAPQYPGTWQWRATTNEREIVQPDGVRIASRVTTIVHYFGWKGSNFHKIIDPVSMYGHRLSKVWPGDEDVIVRLLRWGVALRDFCEENSIELRPTTGGIGAQFLTDSRFYPDARRKVPAATNESTRERMPGNHYHLEVTPSPKEEFTAHYLDQRRSHHYHARTTIFPDANTLYAYGRFVNLDKPVFTYAPTDFYGLYCLDLEFDTHPRFSWLCQIPGVHYSDSLVHRLEKVFVYSNELSHLTDMGYRVTGIRAAWGSRHPDTGLCQFARWAESQLDRYDDPRWLKQILLSAYGTLATRPRQKESVFKEATNGQPVELATGRYKLVGKYTQGKRKLEPGFANVLHRGMIEAATRSESIGLAQWLDATGHRVLSIYADAVIVEHDDNKTLPLLPEPWRTKETLTHLQFINQQAFTSGEMTKLPGVSRDILNYRQASPGYAPRRKKFEALTDREVPSNRRI